MIDDDDDDDDVNIVDDIVFDGIVENLVLLI